MKTTALEMRIDAMLSLGRHLEAVTHAEAAVADRPLSERFWAQLMLALYRSGRQAEALRAYQRLRRRLDEELGIEPSSDLVALEEAVLLHKPELNGKILRRTARRVPPRAQKNRTPPMTSVSPSRLALWRSQGACL